MIGPDRAPSGRPRTAHRAQFVEACAVRRGPYARTVLDLSPWPGLEAVRVLRGGHRNTVYEVTDGTGRFAARLSRRSTDALEWELDLVEFLAGQGFAVPLPLRTADGRRSAANVVVQSWLDGDEPRRADRPRIAAELGRLHRLTTTWPQRPGFASTRDLLTDVRGGDVDLTRMPPEIVAECRTAWRRLVGLPMAVVHGDPGPSNIRIDGERVGLLDWDEARVDHIVLDLADLDPPLPSDEVADAAGAAADAWETANAWTLEPEYARERLARLRSRPG